jgi:hypothetical protein
MNIEIKPFIHQTCFTPKLVWRPLKKKYRLPKSCLQAWAPDRRRETNLGAAEAARLY